jgi:hypothetical protein
VRVLTWILAAVIVVVLLFLYVFPWFDRTFVTDPVVPAEATPYQPEPLGDNEGY